MVAQRELGRSLQSPSVQLQETPKEEVLQGDFNAVQRVEEEEPLQGKFDTTKRVEQEELLQGKSAAETIMQREQQPAEKTDNTGLPDNYGVILETKTDLMEARALTRVQANVDEHSTQTGRGRESKQNLITQRKLPPGEPDTKNFYNARNDKTTMKPYTGGRPADFSAACKANLMEHVWHATEDETGLYHVITPGSQVMVLPSNAIQIDHIEPWKNIEATLTGKYAPQNFKNTNLADSKGNYTIYAARMYYHDVENLRPMAPSDNASKGASAMSTGDAVASELKIAIQKLSANMHDIANEAVQGYERIVGSKIATKKVKDKEVAKVTEEVVGLESPMIDAYNNIIKLGY